MAEDIHALAQVYNALSRMEDAKAGLDRAVIKRGGKQAVVNALPQELREQAGADIDASQGAAQRADNRGKPQGQ